MREATASAPATSANLGPGFDSFGICFEKPMDRVWVRRTRGSGVAIKVSGRGARGIPRDPERNTAGRAALAVMRLAGAETGLEIRVWKGVRPGSGLGSSAASAAAAAVATARLLGLRVGKEELIGAAAEGEAAAAGDPHADNVAPAILGGFTIVRSLRPVEVIRLRPPSRMRLVAALPDVVVNTAYARKILPREIPLHMMVENVGHASTMVAALLKGDLELFGSAMRDEVVEPVRAKLIPGFEDVRGAALSAGAVAATVSGSGPAVLAVADAARCSPARVGRAMERAFEGHRLRCEVVVSGVGRGALAS